MRMNDTLREHGMTEDRRTEQCGLPDGTLLNEYDASDRSDSSLERIKKLIAPVAEKHGLRSVYIFGSYARNEADENSDIDILIDREGSGIHGLFGMNALLNELREVLGKEVDLVTLQSLRQTSTVRNNAGFVESLMKERVKVYG